MVGGREAGRWEEALVSCGLAFRQAAACMAHSQPAFRPAAEEEAALAPETNALAPDNLPPQLLFVHSGQTDMKEMHWHPQVGPVCRAG